MSTRHQLETAVRRWGSVMLALACVGMAGTALGEDEWPERTCDARMQLTVRGDMYAREACTPEIVLNFNDILGADRTLADSSLRLREADTAKGVALDLAEDPEIRHLSGNPVLRLRWEGGGFAAFARKEWVLYFRTVEPGAPKAWRSLPTTFSSRIPPSVLLDTSFEDANPKRPREPLELRAWGEDKKGIHTERIWTDETARTGKRSLKISRTIQPDAVPWSNKPFWRMWPPSIGVQEGGIYRVSVWVKTTRLKSRSWHANVWFRYLHGDMGRVPGKKSMLSMRGPQRACDWTRVSGTLAAPPGARHMTVNLSLPGDGEVFFDDLTVARLPGSELPPLEVALSALENRDDALPGAVGEAAAGKKVFRVSLAKRPPKMDGVLDDPCWKDAGRISDFQIHMKGTDEKDERTTTVSGCADRDALYLAFECVEPQLVTSPIVAEGTGRDGYIWKDDTVEIFLDTNLDQRSFYQIAFNASGTLFDQDIGVPGLPGESWNGPIDVATQIGKGRWTGEVRIGFVGLRLAEAAGQSWTANFCRTSMRGGNRALYTWVAVKRNFGEPKLFGRLLLPLDPTRHAVTARPLVSERVSYGKGSVPVLVINRRGKPVPVLLSVTIVDKKELRLAGRTAVLVKADSEATAQVPCSFPKVGTTNLRFELHEQPSGELLYVTSGEYSVSPPLKISITSSLSYTSEEELGGTWEVGVAEDLLPASQIVLSATSAGKPIPARLKVTPKRASGSFALDVGELPRGRYMLRGELFAGGRTVAQEEIPFERIAGPFTVNRSW